MSLPSEVSKMMRLLLPVTFNPFIMPQCEENKTRKTSWQFFFSFKRLLKTWFIHLSRSGMSSLRACWGVRISTSSICWLCNCFLRDTFDDSHNGSFGFFLCLFFYFLWQRGSLTKEEKSKCMSSLFFPSSFFFFFFFGFIFLSSVSRCSSRRGRRERSSWRTWSRPTRRSTWRRATSRGISTRWSETSFGSSHRAFLILTVNSSFTREPHGLLMIPYMLCWAAWICNM